MTTTEKLRRINALSKAIYETTDDGSEHICAAICDTLGITRQDVKAIRWSATGTRAADALDALLTVAGR